MRPMQLVRRAAGAGGAWARRNWRLLAAGIAAVALLMGIAAALWVFDPVSYPANQAAELTRRLDAVPDPTEREKLRKDIAQYQTDNQIKVWATLVQVGTVAAAVSVGYVGWRNLRATQAKLEEDRKTAAATEVQRTFERQNMEQRLQADREAQITNRFTQAIGQLGAELKDGTPNLEVRLGGIYALERIAKDSPKDYATIMEVLTAYVRQNAPKPPPVTPKNGQEHRPSRHTKRRQKTSRAPLSTSALGAASVGEVWEALVEPKPRADIEAILHVLRRRVPREVEPKDDIIYLHDTTLAGAALVGAHLERAVLQEADLERAALAAAHLTNANLVGASLVGASLQGARLERAGLVFADLRGAYLDGAALTGALLQRADLRGAHLERADLTGAHLEEADLRETIGLTPAQVAQARERGRGALLPEDWPPDWRERWGEEECQRRVHPTQEAAGAASEPQRSEPPLAPAASTPQPASRPVQPSPATCTGSDGETPQPEATTPPGRSPNSP